MKAQYLYFTVFFTGAAILILEILGTRVIGPFYGSTIFVWTSMIVVTLGGLSLGYFMGGQLAEKGSSSRFLFISMFVSGVLFFIPMKVDQFVLPLTDRVGIRFGPLIASTALFFAPLVLLGVIGPIVVKMLTEKTKSTAMVAGRVFAVSTIGSIAGAILAGFILLPYFSVTAIFSIVGMCLVLLSLVGLLATNSDSRNKQSVFYLLLIAVIIFHIPKYYYDDQYTLQILHQQQGFYGDLKVIEIAGIRCIAQDGVAESCRELRKGTSTYFREIASLINRAGSSSMLVLGSGGGDLIEAGVDEKMQIDLVDIDPGIVDLSRHYLNFYPKSNQKVHIDDARHFLRTTNKKYDLIFVDLAKGSSIPEYMFSKQSFELLESRLTDDGFVLMHVLGGVGSEDRSAASIIETAKEVFSAVLPTTTNPDENVSYLIHLSKESDYKVDYASYYGPKFVPAQVNEELGVVLTDDYNPLDILFMDKDEVLLRATRNFGGLRVVFSL